MTTKVRKKCIDGFCGQLDILTTRQFDFWIIFGINDKNHPEFIWKNDKNAIDFMWKNDKNTYKFVWKNDKVLVSILKMSIFAA